MIIKYEKTNIIFSHDPKSKSITIRSSVGIEIQAIKSRWKEYTYLCEHTFVEEAWVRSNAPGCTCWCNVLVALSPWLWVVRAIISFIKRSAFPFPRFADKVVYTSIHAKDLYYRGERVSLIMPEFLLISESVLCVFDKSSKLALTHSFGHCPHPRNSFETFRQERQW